MTPAPAPDATRQQAGRGLFRVGGKWSSLLFAEDGTRNLVLGPQGTAVNMCDELDD